MKLSVVTTLYGSEATVDEFHGRMARAAATVTNDVEFVYVDDGSPDRSMHRLLELRRADSRIAIVDLARNFGHHPAMMCGLEAASGDLIFLIDSDLEEAPELLLDFWRELEANSSADAVYGVQRTRKGGQVERLTGRLWYALFCRMTEVPYPADSLTARLMTRRFVDAVLLHKERDLDMMGIFALAGHEQIPVPAAKTSKGVSSYTPIRRIGIALTGLTSFSTAPLTLIAVTGASLVLASISAGILWLLLWWIEAAPFTFIGLVLWSAWFLTGLVLTAIGILAVYAGKILQEVKGRPRAIVRDIHHSGKS